MEDEYRRQSTVEEQDAMSERSATPAYSHSSHHRAETPHTPHPHTPHPPDFNLVSHAQRAAEAQGYSLVTGHPQHQGYPGFVSHPLLHQIQSNWTAAMYSHIQQPPQ